MSARRSVDSHTALPNIINFSLPAGLQTISPVAPLPAITQQVDIQGDTANGFSTTNPKPLIEITGDNPLTAAAIAREAGIDDFLAQATPKDKMDLIKREQGDGKLVAMTGDGTNDAPALAQADVGVAMNTGTQAAKEAGNMVDLDSNPTKLIEIVEIGKQLPAWNDSFGPGHL